MTDRALIFIDGNNWFHSLKETHVGDRFNLDYGKISSKLVGPRDWLGTHYYIGRISQKDSPKLYADQRRFLSSLEATDSRISTHLGRIEKRPLDDPAALELHEYLSSLKKRIDQQVFRDLMTIAKKHRSASVNVEKAVDVHLAVDMVAMAERNEYDAAYLLSADGDFTPAVEAARDLGKKVYIASPQMGAKLAGVADSFIRLERSWFADCYR